MKLTPRQFQTLQWLSRIGGQCVAHGEKLRSLSHKTQHGEEYPAVCGLHLVQKGCIEARNGALHITEYGKRMIAP
jgi:hypothetical protein